MEFICVTKYLLLHFSRIPHCVTLYVIILDSRGQKVVKSSFTVTHGMILLSAILAIAVVFFVTKEVVNKTRRGKRKERDGFEKEENLNQLS